MQRQRDFDLADLDAFLAVCETSSMTEAAKRLGATESAISHLVKRMEKRMGITLFDRSIRPLKPTVLGAQLYGRGRQLLQDATGIALEMRVKGRVQYTHLGIGLIETLGTWFATRLIGELASNSRSWKIVSGSNAELWQHFYARELSALIVLEDDERREGAVKTPLLTESVVLVTPAMFHHLSLMQLASDVPFIGAHKDSGFGRLTSAYFSRLKIDVTPAATFGSLDSVLMMVAQGFGWALAPSLLLLRETPERHQVMVRPLEKATISRRIALVAWQYEHSALTGLIATSAHNVFKAQIAKTQMQHPDLFARLSFAIAAEGGVEQSEPTQNYPRLSWNMS